MTYAPPPAYGYPVPMGPPPRAAIVKTANTAGIVIAIVGGAVALIGTLVDWYDGSVKLSDLIHALSASKSSDATFPNACFGWLMWVVLGLTVVAAVFANTPGGMSGVLRAFSPILAIVGIALIVVALNDLIKQGSIFDHAKPGLFLVLVGFVIAGIGGMLGPRRVRGPLGPPMAFAPPPGYGPPPVGPPTSAPPPSGPPPSGPPTSGQEPTLEQELLSEQQPSFEKEPPEQPHR